jgi:hypothetical protein
MGWCGKREIRPDRLPIAQIVQQRIPNAWRDFERAMRDTVVCCRGADDLGATRFVFNASEKTAQKR